MGFMLRNDVGIDLGTASVLVYVKGKGIVLQEPSVVAIDQFTNKFLAVGEEARKMLGRTPGNIVAVSYDNEEDMKFIAQSNVEIR